MSFLPRCFLVAVALCQAFAMAASAQMVNQVLHNPQDHIEKWYPTKDGEKFGPFWRAYDGRTKANRWTLEVLRLADLEDNVKRAGSFHIDTTVPQEFRPSPRDYTLADPDGNRYDQGHLAASANYHKSEDDQKATFAITNAVPETAEMNRYPMRLLEDELRRWLERGSCDFILVVTAPAYVPLDGKITVQTIGANSVWVPTHVVKVSWCYRLGSGKYHAHAWMIPNDRVKDRDFRKCQVSIDEAEAATGLDFLQPVDDKLEALLEKTIDDPV